jgi:diaminopimelate decarboxylase
MGGGFGIACTRADNPPSIPETIKTISDTIIASCKQYDLRLPYLFLEPGRSVIARAGITLYTIGSQKQIINEQDQVIKHYISVDGGMADNPRPITYQAAYEAELVKKNRHNTSERTYCLAGKYCESGDILIKAIDLPTDLISGELLVIFATGAYNYSMSSNYNRVCKPAMVMVHEGQADIIVQRESLEDLTRNDLIPSRFQQPIKSI